MNEDDYFVPDEKDFLGTDDIEDFDKRLKQIKLNKSRKNFARRRANKNRYEKKKKAAWPYKLKTPTMKNGGGKKKQYRYAMVDPITFEIFRLFDNVIQLENYTGFKRLGARINNYSRAHLSPKSEPTIFGYVVVRYEPKEVFGMEREFFLEFIFNKARRHLIIAIFDRIKHKIVDMDEDTINKLFNYLHKVDSIKIIKHLEE